MLYPAKSPDEARAVVKYHRQTLHAGKPAYEIAAWRCMALKQGHTGLEGPDDFELKMGFDDGGEQWAGGRILKVLQAEGMLDVVVIVSRWSGTVFVLRSLER